MSSPKQVHYIRVELPPDATEEERDTLWKEVTDLAVKYSEEFDYDIHVDGGAWWREEDLDETTPYLVALGNLRRFINKRDIKNSPTEAHELHGILQELHERGMSKEDMMTHLERLRAINDVVRRNQSVEDNITDALSMVTGFCSPHMAIKFQAGTQ